MEKSQTDYSPGKTETDPISVQVWWSMQNTNTADTPHPPKHRRPTPTDPRTCWV